MTASVSLRRKLGSVNVRCGLYRLPKEAAPIVAIPLKATLEASFPGGPAEDGSGVALVQGPPGVSPEADDEGSHNKGITVGLVDPRMVGSARPLGEIYTGCVRADHGILNPDPDANELWISCNSSFETVILDLSKRETRGDFSPSDYVKARIPSPNGGSTHNGAFVQYNADWTGRVLADQNGLYGSAL